MAEEYIFTPQRRQGGLFHLAALALLSLVALAGLWQAAHATIGPVFLAYLLPALAALVIAPVLAYRYYCLQTGSYSLGRDGIRLRWGLRVEQISIDNVLWVRPAAELSQPLPLPRLRWPGAVVGQRQAPGLGQVEFMAASGQDVILIATPGGGFAVSPADVPAFLQAFQRCIEMGSLAPLPDLSVYPTVLFVRVWQSHLARGLLLGGALLSLAVLVTVSLAIPTRTQIALGKRSAAEPGYLVPAVRLLLLPVLNSIFFTADVVLGLFFYRRQESRVFAYVLWVGGVLMAAMFLAAVIFILISG